MSNANYSASPEDDIILLMGATGAGKSSFIETFTGKTDVGVGHGMQSGTTRVNLFSCNKSSPNGKNLVLVDTPGLGDTSRSDMEVLKILSQWLIKIYKRKISPTGIIFFQKITENPLSQSSRKQLAIFRRLWGPDCLKNVVIVTTMWDLIEPEQGTVLEESLRDDGNFWKPLMQRESRFVRFVGTQASASHIIDLFKGKSPLPLQLQIEMGEQGKKLEKTAAGIAILALNNDKGLFFDNRYHLSLQDETLSKDDAIVLVMGATGTGQRSFIETVAGKEFQTHFSRQAEIPFVHAHILDRYYINNRRLVFVEMPGFDDAKASDADVLETMGTWLAASYNQHIIPAGIIFFHEITDNRIVHSMVKTLQLFRSLCGVEVLQNVVIVTTRWDLVDPEIGAERESVLCASQLVWKPLIDRNSQVRRFDGTLESALDIVNLLRETKRLPLQLQCEVVDLRKTLGETGAGIIIVDDLKALSLEHEQSILELTRERRRLNDKQLIRITEEEIQMLRLEQEKVKESRRFLKRNGWQKIGDQILNTATFSLSTSRGR